MSAIETYKRILLEWNRRLNLLGPEATANVDEHIAEALEAAALLQPRGRVLDFGSGGGLPAIPMAIAAPDAEFHLVEADQRKWSFLKFVARECGLKATVHGDRLDRLVSRLDPDLRFQVVTSRAVGHPEEWLHLIAPFLDDDAEVALFQRGTPHQTANNFKIARVLPLSRGDQNALVVLRHEAAGAE